jgi:hypothetical protein
MQPEIEYPEQTVEEMAGSPHEPDYPFTPEDDTDDDVPADEEDDTDE